MTCYIVNIGVVTHKPLSLPCYKMVQDANVSKNGVSTGFLKPSTHIAIRADALPLAAIPVSGQHLLANFDSSG